jgi:hypothetical protein
MTRNVVFLVHGVGRQGAGWATAPGGPVPVLTEAARGYGVLDGTALAERLDLVEVRYDDIFDTVLDRWGELADGLQGGAGVLPGGFERARRLLAEAGDDRNVFYRYGGDAVLYKAFGLVARAVRLRVMARLASTVATCRTAAKDAGEPEPRYAVVAHSLGTAVAHDSLHELAVNRWTDPDDPAGGLAAVPPGQRDAFAAAVARAADNPFAPSAGFRWNCVFMLANTSPLLHQIPEGPLASVVHPGGDGCCQTFFNVQHALDPVGRFPPFEMPADWERAGVGYRLKVDHIHAPNVHGFGHYLAHPEVHRHLFLRMVPGFGMPGYGEGAELAAAFPRDTVTPALAAEVRARLGALAVSADLDGWEAALKAVAGLSDLAGAGAGPT